MVLGTMTLRADHMGHLGSPDGEYASPNITWREERDHIIVELIEGGNAMPARMTADGTCLIETIEEDGESLKLVSVRLEGDARARALGMDDATD